MQQLSWSVLFAMLTKCFAVDRSIERSIDNALTPSIYILPLLGVEITEEDPPTTTCV